MRAGRRPAGFGLFLAATFAAQGGSLPLERGGDPNDWQAYYVQGLRELRHNKPRLAESYFAYAARLDPSVAEPLIARYGAWWKAHPGLLNRMWLRGRERSQSREIDSVETWLREALLLNPLVDHRPLAAMIPEGWAISLDAWDRGYFALFRGETEKSVAAFTEVLRDDPEDQSAYRWRGLAHATLGQWSEAAADFEALIQRVERHRANVTSPSDVPMTDLYHTLGFMRLFAGDTAAAKGAFQSSFVEDLSFHLGHMHYGMLLWAEGDTTAALLEYALAAELKPDDPVVRQNYGAVLLVSGRPDSALAHFQAGVRLAPEYALAYFNLGMCLERLGQTDAAREAFRGFLTRAPRRLASLIQQAQRRVGPS